MLPYANDFIAHPGFADVADLKAAGKHGRRDARRRTRIALKKRARTALKRDTARRLADAQRG